MRRLALLVIVVVIGISVLASLGYGPRFFGWVNRIPGRDATGHLVLMGMLSLFVNLGFSSHRIGGRRLGVIGCTALVLLAVTLEELVQILVPARDFSLRDLFSSYAGIGICSVAAAVVLSRGGPERP